jgi:hypothetical protein
VKWKTLWHSGAGMGMWNENNSGGQQLQWDSKTVRWWLKQVRVKVRLLLLALHLLFCVSTDIVQKYNTNFFSQQWHVNRQKHHLYRVIRNDCPGFNNLPYTIHFR